PPCCAPIRAAGAAATDLAAEALAYRIHRVPTHVGAQRDSQQNGRSVAVLCEPEDMIGIVITSAAVLAYIYGGYYLVLRLAVRQAAPLPAGNRLSSPTLTVLITVHNEQAQIHERVQNVLDCQYNPDRLEVL